MQETIISHALQAFAVTICFSLESDSLLRSSAVYYMFFAGVRYTPPLFRRILYIFDGSEILTLRRGEIIKFCKLERQKSKIILAKNWHLPRTLSVLIGESRPTTLHSRVISIFCDRKLDYSPKNLAN